jgi:hypothetical protein
MNQIIKSWVTEKKKNMNSFPDYTNPFVILSKKWD